MADLALSNVSNRNVESLTQSEYRRVAIGVQLVRDPVVLLLDEPTADLDPLNTYFVISILANHAKKYNRIVLLAMEKPRSDIFPFLDRVTYLCLGDVVYTGATRMMLDYFRSIGFPCPELENPLMYYCKKRTLTLKYQNASGGNKEFFSMPVHRRPAIKRAIYRVEQPDRVPRGKVQA